VRMLFGRKPDVRYEVEQLHALGVEPDLRTRLAAWLASAPDRELYRCNPRLAAARLSLDERGALQLLVLALHQGLVALHWEIHCPACGNRDTSPSLAHMRGEHDCSVCRTRFATDADDNVRVSFSIDARLRQLPPSANDAAFRADVDARYGPVSGHTLLTLQRFRDLFPSHTLPPHESMLVRRVAILFTDLAGSTALYVRRGDPRAFELVRQHFDQLFAAVDDHCGAVIKTIGDAVMGAFTSPASALRAALAMHAAVADLNAALHLTGSDRLVLKIGVHVGPCISVNLNGHMDYFGTVVNTAARVQQTSQGGDIAISAAVLADPAAAAVLANREVAQQELLLKGLDAPLAVYHARLASALVPNDHDLA
jgi:class 3 adenylate cyclase